LLHDRDFPRSQALIAPLFWKTVSAKQPEVVSKLSGLGVEVVGGSPADFGRLIKSDSERLGRVIRDANIRLD
jgi:hypothetical protein